MLSPTRYRVQVVDLEYYKRNIPCQHACPTHTDARGYVNAIARGEYERAYYIARQPNPFATACGRICVAPCEAACRRGKVDAPISIRALKRFVTQRYGVEGDYSFPAAPPGQDNSATYESQQAIGSRRGEGRVAVIGSGPAGLTAAHDLALLGYQVSVFEALPFAGGYMATALPSYRLPGELIKLEVQAVLRLGAELHTASPVGPEAPAADLKKRGYRAVFLATGVEKKQRPFSPAEGVFTEAGMGVEGGGIIHAVAVGHRAARAIDAFLLGKQARVQSRGWLEPIDPTRFFDLPYLHVERRDPRLHPFPVDGEMEAVYTEEEALTQARRCLTCHLQTVFDGPKCILCGGCVDVCPMNCLKLVRIDQVYGDSPVSALIDQDTAEGRRPVAAMIKDETRCIRCGLCHRRCPTGAVQLMAFWFTEEVIYD